MAPTRVLLIDDDETQYVFVRTLLHALDTHTYDLTWAGTYADGLAALCEDRFDVALVDLRLASCSGLDLIREAGAPETLSTPVIMITGYGDRLVDLQAMELGAAEFLDKAELTAEMLDRTLRYTVRQSQAHRLLREREERFHALIQHAWDAVLILDRSFRIVFASDSTRNVTGFEPAELIGADACSFVHPEDAAVLRQRLFRAARAFGSRMGAECRCRHKEGSWRDCEIIVVNRIDDPAVCGIVLNYRDVTERNRAEAERRYLAAIVQSSHESIIGTSLDGVIRSWNSGAERLFGFRAAELVGRSKIDVLMPGGQQEHMRVLHQRVATGETISPFETVRRRRDGTLVDVSLALSPIRDAEGVVTGISAVARDITRQREAQTAAIESVREYRSLFDASPLGLAHTSLDGHWVRVNRSLCQMLGYTEEDLQGTAFTACIHPDDVSHALDEQADLVAGRERQQGERRYRRRDGRYVWVRTHAQVYREATGAAGYVIMALEDISAFKAAEERLRRTVDQLQAVVSSVPMALWALDRDGTVTFSEGRLLHRFGVQPGELVGRSQLAPFAATPEIVEVTRRALAGEQVHATVSLCGGIFETWYSPLVSDEGVFVGTIGVAVEITDRLKLEEQFRQAQKMEAIGRLAGGVAHDFNNLLTAIIGYGELALGELPPDSGVRADVEEICKAGHSAAALTRQLLAFSRRQVLQPQALFINDIVIRMRSLLGRVIGADIALTTDLDAVRPVYADPSQIEQIVMNLAVNARDAMPHGGRLTIRTANVQLHDDFVRHHPGATAGPHVLLAVTDTGIGIAPEIRARLFEPFFTTKESGKGTGLGLPTVYGIVTQTGGALDVDSEPGRGTTFTIYLPVTGAGERDDQGDLDLPTTSLRGSETLLLVEDQDEVRAVARQTLERHGYRVLDADSPARALALSVEVPSIDLLLTDIVMPGMSGHALAAQLSGQRPSLRILYTSGYADNSILQHGDPANRPPFLQKPFTSAALLAKVREVLDAAPRPVAH